ncbi:MAG: GDP-L-fucose synthase [Pseudomonadota bacterium]|nr:GDP-L-fucose synthase [Pseudomonadota bacterium]
MISKDSKIYIAGHNGMVGSAILRALENKGYSNLLLKNRTELDLTKFDDVQSFLSENKPDYIFLAAARVGGIKANSESQAEFLYENITIQNNILYTSHKLKIKNLMFLGSSCIYPKNAPQPLKEEYLLTSELEKTNEGYALAKIAGIKLCQYYNDQYNHNYVSVMPTNLYGPNDNYDLTSSHVLPAIISKIHTAKINNLKEVMLWGSGRPKREFLHVDDLADACIFLMEKSIHKGIYNIGTQKDITISELAAKVAEIIGYSGKINFDTNMPDGTMRKILDISKITDIGWNYKIKLDAGIKSTYLDYLKTING